MLVYGGFVGEANEYESGAAAAYDPRRNRWRTLPAWQARWGHSAVWTGREMIVWGGDGPYEFERNGASLDSRTGRWRPLTRSPLEGRVGHSALWTGRGMIVLGGASNRQLRREGATYDPARKRWSLLPRSPGGFLAWASAYWIGEQMLVIDRGSRVLVYRPETRKWRRLRSSALRPRREFASAWTGREVVVWGGEADPDDRYLADGAALTPLRGQAAAGQASPVPVER